MFALQLSAADFSSSELHILSATSPVFINHSSVVGYLLPSVELQMKFALCL